MSQGVFSPATLISYFRHGNIIKYCDRPFNSIQEMDHALIQNWNKVVSEDDIVFHLGDFAFADKSKWRQIANALKGKKYLIQGNHDRSYDIPTECFEAVGDMMQVSIEYEDSWHKFLLSHRPFYALRECLKIQNNYLDIATPGEIILVKMLIYLNI